jgi:hypothetical protein
MQMAFLPAQLFLERLPDGTFQVRQGSEILGTFKSAKQASNLFLEVRRKLEADYPMPEPSPEQKRQAMIEELGRAAVSQASMRNAPPRKPTGTRTFG